MSANPHSVAMESHMPLKLAGGGAGSTPCFPLPGWKGEGGAPAEPDPDGAGVAGTAAAAAAAFFLLP